MAEAHETLAPWAEIVPDTGPMTVDDLLTLPDDGWQYELVDGRLVRMAGSGQRATTIAAILLGVLIAFVRPRRLGVVTGADGVYKFDPVRETGLIPDVGFYVAARQSRIVDPNKPIPLAAKVALYLAGGTRLVWVIWADRQQVDVWHPGDTGPSATLGVGDTLDGEDVIPGFIHPVADIFAQ